MTGFEQKWKELGGENGALGSPVSGVVSVALGQAVYYQRGCLWMEAPSGKIYPMILEAPLPGCPALLGTTARTARIHICKTDARLDVLEQVWHRRIFLQPVVKPGSPKAPVPLELDAHSGGGSNHLTCAVDDDKSLTDRTLYNLCYRTPQGGEQVISYHAAYARTSWENFDFTHITDIHVSRRLDSLFAQLKKAGLTEGAAALNNFNDRFRDFVRYANAMHEAGDLDMILATGDLVDYVYEDDDDRHGPGNFGLFERIILGKAPYADRDDQVEELRIPIFTVLGNHDYRANAYPFVFTVTTFLGIDASTVKQFDSLNLTNSEAEDFFGKRVPVSTGSPPVTSGTVLTFPSYDSDGAGRFLEIADGMRERTNYYFRRINRETSYVIHAGPHRIAMLDSGWDVGVPEGTWDAIWTELGNGSEDKRRLLGGGPNSRGPGSHDVEMVNLALQEAGDKGVVVVGIHAPLLNIQGNEYSHYFRETEHPTADPKETTGFVWRRLKGSPAFNAEPQKVEPEWTRSGTRYFKTGRITNLLDSGVSRGDGEYILTLCSGRGAPRPADLVLFGHVHRDVEYRADFDERTKQTRFYHDYYLANPGHYYPSKKVAHNDFRQDDELLVAVDRNSKPGGNRVKVRDQRTNQEYTELHIPPCSNALETAQDAQAWWQENRPVLAQTGPLGPIENAQRDSGDKPPKPTFQGFRMFAVEDHAIVRSAYVRANAMRQEYRSPWRARVSHA